MSARRWTLAAGAATAFHLLFLAVDSLAPETSDLVGALAGISMGLALLAIGRALLAVLEESEQSERAAPAGELEDNLAAGVESRQPRQPNGESK